VDDVDDVEDDILIGLMGDVGFVADAGDEEEDGCCCFIGWVVVVTLGGERGLP
jgi:hypothetical protein